MADLNPITDSFARQPRGAIKLNSTLVPWTSFEVENNAFSAADTFHATLAVGALPAGVDVSWFVTQAIISVEIFATADVGDADAYAPSPADRLILGHVDDIDWHPVDGTIALSGRDLTAALIDTKTSENYQNATSSDVAILLAQRHGLTPVVTKTTNRIGNFYAQDHTDINQQQSEWDLLLRLANFENFDVFVVGNELHFQPKPSADADRYAIEYIPPAGDRPSPMSNTSTISFSRSLTIAKGVTVEVKSWNAKQKRAFTASWPKAAQKTKPGQAGGEGLPYHFQIPGLTQDQATARAQQLYNQIVQHMVKLEADLPGDAILDCTKTIAVRGTGTILDQAYYPDSIKRTMSMEEGYRMTISAKNVSRDVEAAAA